MEWRPFDLHPEYPPEGIPREDLLRRYGSQFEQRLNEMFSQAGLPFAQQRQKVPNSRRSLLLGELARDRGVYDALHPRLFDAYWRRGNDLGDERVLVEEGKAVGLEQQEIAAALSDRGYQERVEQSTQAALELGAGGVPAWLVDRRLLIPGAQPHELFDRVLEGLGYRPAE